MSATFDENAHKRLDSMVFTRSRLDTQLIHIRLMHRDQPWGGKTGTFYYMKFIENYQVQNGSDCNKMYIP